MEYCLIEDLYDKKDLGIKLETIFDDVCKKLEGNLPKKSKLCTGSENVILTPQMEAINNLFNRFSDAPETPDAMVAAVIDARNSSSRHTACRSGSYGNKIKRAINEVLEERGIDLEVN